MSIRRKQPPVRLIPNAFRRLFTPQTDPNIQKGPKSTRNDLILWRSVNNILLKLYFTKSHFKFIKCLINLC